MGQVENEQYNEHEENDDVGNTTYYPPPAPATAPAPAPAPATAPAPAPATPGLQIGGLFPNPLPDWNNIYNAIDVLLNDNLNINRAGNYIVNDKPIMNIIRENIDKLDSREFDDIEKRNIVFTIITLITEEIKKMVNKPLIQDTISLITYINNYCNNNNFNCRKYFLKINEFDELNINDILNGNINNQLLLLIKDNNNLHLIPYLYVLIDKNRDENLLNDPLFSDYNFNKLKESKHLGLYYRGLIPTYSPNIEDITGYPFINIPINKKLLQFYFYPNPIVVNSLPFIGNYYWFMFNQPIDQYEIKLKFNTYSYVNYKYRPPIKKIVKNADEYVQFFIRKNLSEILYSAINEQNLYTIIDSNTQLSKAFLDIYIYLSFLYDFLDKVEIKSYIDTIIKNINDYNANLLLYYYLFKSNSNKYKIPKFNYYLLPLLNKKNSGKFTYFSNSVNKIDLNTLKDNNMRHSITKFNDISYNVEGNIRNAKSYLDVMEYIENNIISGIYNIENDNFVENLSNKLPPAIIDKLKDFYTYNIKLSLINLYKNTNINNILDELSKLNKFIENDTFIDNNITNYYFMSKIFEELIREKMEYHIELQTNRILYKVIKKEDLTRVFKDNNHGIILQPEEFILNMNKISNVITSFYFEYQFSKVKKPEEVKFIIYPDEYANSEILKLKYELIIKENIYKYLLDGNSNPYILDSNNQSPIFLLLKYHIPDVLKNIKDLKYNDFSEIKPHDFLLLELKNHTHKLTNGTDKYTDWIENFVSYQKNEVTTLILSNDKFGNNVPLYLEDSFNVITYITNQYLSEHVYKIKSYLFINKIINELSVYDDIKFNIMENIYDNKKIEINNSLETGNTNSLNKEINTLVNKLQSINKSRNTYKTRYNISDDNILNRYNKLVSSKLNNLTILLSKFINTDLLNNSDELLTFDCIKFDEQIILDKSLKDINYLNLKNIKDFYKKTNEISNRYFTYNKYTNKNDVLKFSKDLLIFMTQNFICFPYFMLLNKILVIYFKSIYVTDNDKEIIVKVHYCLTNKILKNENQSIKNILYYDVSKKLVLNAVQIFDNQEEENLFSQESTKNIFDTVVNLLTINPSLSISEDSSFFKTTNEINSYFDTFVNKTILNWLVIIENVFKFNINQGRIIESIYNLHF
jgi:hypothetical protein